MVLHLVNNSIIKKLFKYHNNENIYKTLQHLILNTGEVCCSYCSIVSPPQSFTQLFIKEGTFILGYKRVTNNNSNEVCLHQSQH